MQRKKFFDAGYEPKFFRTLLARENFVDGVEPRKRIRV
jgi:hypothetical protein